MRKAALAAACAALVLLTVNVAFGADAEAGKKVFAAKCASCHNADGAGKDSVAKMMKVEMKALGSKEVQAKSDAELAKIITDGTGKMKPVSGVDAKAAGDVVLFLRTLKK